MGFSINSFVSEINKSNIARSDLFIVNVFGKVPGNSELERSISLRCDSVTTPGRTISTTDYQLYGMNTKLGYDSAHGSFDISVILSEDFREKLYFEKWQDMIVGNYRLGKSNTQMYEIGFYDDYVGTVDILSYNDIGELKYKKSIKEAYPITIGDIQRTWTSTEIIKLPVTFAYNYFTDE